MPTSADRSGTLAQPATARVQGGFTLLEIMLCVAIIGVVLLPMLQARGQAQALAFRAERMFDATNLAQEFLAVRIRDLQSVREERGVIEEDPSFRYEFTLENFDLSTGYGEDEEQTDPFGDYQGYVPGDAQSPDEKEERTPYKVRRYELTLSWDGFDEDSEEESYKIEGYLPRIWDPETSSLSPDEAQDSGTDDEDSQP